MTKNSLTLRLIALLAAALMLCSALCGCDLLEELDFFDDQPIINGNGADLDDDDIEESSWDLSQYPFASVEGIPDYSGEAYVSLNGNMPEFTDDEKVTASYEYYSELDSLGRCGYTIACVGTDIMPTEDRESISSVKPSGWINKKYDKSIVDGGYLYNRCHLIGFQLTGENANKQNLITGTRYLNIEGMLPFENMVADYVKETGNHVMYRVTPIFVGNNLLASGVKVEGWSVEDDGDGICFNVFAYNVQPGIVIDYATGNNALSADGLPETDETDGAIKVDYDYVLNKGNKKIHTPTCHYAESMKAENRVEYSGSIDDLLADGYTKCKTCDP